MKAGNTVAYKAGKNIVVKQDGQNITYSTTDKPIFDVVNANEFKAGDVVVNNQGINAGNKKSLMLQKGQRIVMRLTMPNLEKPITKFVNWKIN
ncbi:Uncharacterised protein [Rodentibacter pneumotropicus]|uniref:Uncharacterized protein n=1 Tax=Rodentibacter pneumotropicus TaxID=758 RepID=A0A448MIS9_9PAST|nr:Uncharacterised protein [Rodentibacter pneumotropicus]